MRTEPLAAHDPASAGPWRLVGRIGAGGMGVVYLGRRTSGGRTHQAAVKLISSDVVGRDVAVSRFRREIAVLMSVDDPGVARVIAADLDEDPPWYAADLIDGPTVASHVRDDGPMAHDLWPSLALSLASTLTRLHDRRIVHRDLKPQNVVLGRSGPVIIDFGISAVVGSTSLTATGASPRTELWASPEQLRNEEAVPASDIFALGALLAWSATARHPFAAQANVHPEALFAAVLSSPPLLEGLSPNDLRWLAPMLAKEPSNRPTAVEVVESILDVGPEEAAVRARRAQACGWSAAARSWWRVVADAGGVEAYIELGRLSAADGDARAARSWWLMAQAAGHPEAPSLLAGDAADAQPAGLSASSGVGPSEPTLVSSDGHRGDVWRPAGSYDAAAPASLPQRLDRGRGTRRALAFSVGTVATLVLAWLTASMAGWPADTPPPITASNGSYSTRPVKVALGAEGAASTASWIAVGDTSACVITNGRARCWGSNSAGQLGSPGGDSDVPRAVDTSGVLDGVRLHRITVGREHACALDEAGQMYCWGSNSKGQLGVDDPDVEASAMPMRVGGPAVQGRSLDIIGAGGASTCALDSEGVLLCWGDNSTGQIGDGWRTDRDMPVPVETSGDLGGRPISRFGVGGDHTCAIDTAHSLYCWGNNDRGQLGDNSRRTSLLPIRVDSTEEVKQGEYESVKLGEGVTCAATSERAACWGANDQGQLGSGSGYKEALLPQEVAATVGALPFNRLAVSGPTVCGISKRKVVHCWGDNSSGQLGTGTTQDSSLPDAVTDPAEGALPPLKLVAGGPMTSCAVGEDGSAWCWVSNQHGLLGAGG